MGGRVGGGEGGCGGGVGSGPGLGKGLGSGFGIEEGHRRLKFGRHQPLCMELLIIVPPVVWQQHPN